MQQYFVEEAPKCLKCGKDRISYKLYGMPEQKNVQELEKFLNVKLMGCVPPFKNENVNLYKCHNCQYEWGDYEKLDFFLELRSGPSRGNINEEEFIIWDKSLFTFGFGNNIIGISLPDNDKILKFWNKLSLLNIKKWKKNYSEGLDGWICSLMIESELFEKNITMINKYPPKFDQFVNAVEELSGFEFSEKIDFNNDF